uniref:Uncharacterized protein n=1 Tax=Oryza meridionalis TaxID=40149 RepID=A0A0E0F868_9ORYZ
MEEAGERCFDELVSRGFISPAPPFPPAGLKIKSCIVDPSVKTFISNISKSDNFIDDLPTHLQHQIDIRKLAQKPQPQQHKPWWWCPLPTCINCSHDDDGGKPLPPMDERVKLLKKLPEEYRLNVLDLGGCTGLTMRHLTSICELVHSLKYLSLRKTNVFWLPSQMSNLLHLETLDIRDTRVQAKATRNIFLQELRHLLAGGGGNIASDAATQLSTEAEGDEQFVLNGFTAANPSFECMATVTPNGLLMLTNGTNQLKGHAFFPAPLQFHRAPNSTAMQSFSTALVIGIIGAFVDQGSGSPAAAGRHN